MPHTREAHLDGFFGQHRPVEIANILADDALQVSLTKDQHMVQAFAPLAAQESIAYRICAWGAIRSIQYLKTAARRHPIKGASEFAVVIAHDEFGMNAIGRRFA